MTAKQVLIVTACVSFILAIVGCAPKIVGTDAAVYSYPKLYAVSSDDMDMVYNDVLAAMEKLQLNVTDKAKDAFSAKVIAKTASNKKVSVIIKPAEDNKTSFTIQSGMMGMGGKELSQQIYDEIKK